MKSLCVLTLIIVMSMLAACGDTASPATSTTPDLEATPQALSYYRLGLAQYLEGENDKAMTNFSKAIELDPKHADAYFWRGYLYRLASDFDKAIADFDKAIELNPNFVDAYYWRGHLYRLADDFDKALADFDRAIELNPEYVGAYDGRSRLYWFNGDLDRSIADMEKIIQLDPHYDTDWLSTTYGMRGLEYLSKENYVSAISNYDRAIELDPEDAGAYYFRGQAHAGNGDYDRAIADYDIAIKLNSGEGPSHFYFSRGLAQAAKGSYDKAIADYDKALELSPDYPQATNARERAYRSRQPTPEPIVNQWDAPPAMTIDTSKDYKAVIELEKGGAIVIDLFEKRAPMTVNNFVFLANEGFYDGVTFHRVLEGFMAQAGDPTGTGGGGPGYRFDNELSTALRHDGPGILSMANAGMRDGKGTNGSQFFITFRETHFLDGYNLDGSLKDCVAESCHSVFGKVGEGSLDVVMSISLRDPNSATTLGDMIKTIRIEQE